VSILLVLILCSCHIMADTYEIVPALSDPPKLEVNERRAGIMQGRILVSSENKAFSPSSDTLIQDSVTVAQGSGVSSVSTKCTNDSAPCWHLLRLDCRRLGRDGARTLR
jgi:hypothetical protein